MPPGEIAYLFADPLLVRLGRVAAPPVKITVGGDKAGVMLTQPRTKPFPRPRAQVQHDRRHPCRARRGDLPHRRVELGM